MVRKSEKRIIANYIGWRVAKATMRYLGSQARKIRQDFRKSVYGYKTEWPRYLELIMILMDQRLLTGPWVPGPEGTK